MKFGIKYLILILICCPVYLLSTAFRSPGKQAYNSGEPDPVQLDSPEVELLFPIGDPANPNNTGGSSIDLLDPLNLSDTVLYDPQNNGYLIQNSIGDSITYQAPTYMPLDEYIQYDLDKFMDENWKRLISEGSEGSSEGIVPPMKVSKKFEDIFGEGGIDIRPTGTAELTFGINTSRTDNPQIPVKQRRITVFDFNERIQLNVVGTIGSKLKLSTSYNTEATFDFENQMKLEYKGDEDEIIQSMEAGNVSLPLGGTLITGSQSLFGIKSELKFGRLTISSVLSQQKGKKSEVNVSGGAQVTEYEVKADNYEANKHYFLSQYFRDQFNDAMRSLPQPASRINITRIEVWITNTNNTTTDTRNIVALTDLGEVSDLQSSQVVVAPGANYPDNQSNDVYSDAANNSGVRTFTNATNQLQSMGYQASVDFEKVENARRLSDQEFSYNSLLGYISLNQSLNNDEVLGVAFQYTIGSETYQVGEFSTDGIDGQNALILKLLKPTITNPKNKIWDLMMKNIYAIGAYQVSPMDFKLDVWYNNPTTSVQIPFLPYNGVDDKPLIQVIGLDRINTQSAPYPDGYFDFVPVMFEGNKGTGGGTINPRNGRVIFTTVEPFGDFLKQKLLANGMSTLEAGLIAFEELYDSTKTVAQNTPSKNRFYIKGSYESSTSSEISLNALNIPKGAVVVTAGGNKLIENQDYTVDYNLGRVKIINDGLLQSQVPIKVSLESNSLFNIQTKTLLGSHFDYRLNKDANVGATIMRLSERPLTQKVEFGDEPIKNTQLGIDGNMRKDIPLLTKWIDKYVPFIKTKEKSTITFSAEAATLIPGHSRAIGKEGIAYIDDFEGSQSSIDLRSFSQWTIASIPKGQPDIFPEAELNNDLRAGYKRAQISRFTIDPLFHNANNLTPTHIANNVNNVLNNHNQRQILLREVFPNLTPRTGTPNNIAVFELSYYPKERGQYNYGVDPDPSINFSGFDSNGEFANPSESWGGIMRALNTNDFEAANVEFIQFWMMDPYNSDTDPNHEGGDLYFNLGNISEDILPDSRKAFENGVPIDGSNEDLDKTNWGRVPTNQAIVQAFDNDPTARVFQDIGYDLLIDTAEANFHSDYVTAINNSSLSQTAKNKALADPSSDNYKYYLNTDHNVAQHDILRRYKYYINSEGNSNTSEQDQELAANGFIDANITTSATNTPNIEDINRDNNMSESESYFQYKVSMRPQDLDEVGKNYIADIFDTTSVQDNRPIRWIQFRIPVREPEKSVNGITDFRSIRFMRMFMKNFAQFTHLRFARLELIRGEWRTYYQSLLEDGEYIQGDPDLTTFNVSAVNTNQNTNRRPINYQIPPDIIQEQDVTDPSLRLLNEQSLAMEVCGLLDGDSRAAYKTLDLDVRRYKRLKMFIHGENEDLSNPTDDDDVTVFIRLGTDFTDNYYEYELPLVLTDHNLNATAREVWPLENEIDLAFQTLKDIKLQRPGSYPITEKYTVQDPENADRQITIVGNPNLAGIKTIMIGIRNPHRNTEHPWQPDDGQSKCVEVWVNELRLAEFEEKGGYAALSRVSVQGADFMRVDLAGSISTPGWGSIEKRVNERQLETIKQFDASANFQLGKFFNKDLGLRIPMFLNYSVSAIDPQYDPLQPDILWNELPDNVQANRKSEVRDYTQSRALNFTNVSKARKQGKDPKLWDIANWSVTYAYNETFHRDFNTAYNMNKTYKGGLYYGFNNNPDSWKPFSKVGFVQKSKWLKLFKDFELFKGPKQIGFRNDIMRTDNVNVVRSAFQNLVKPQFNRRFEWNRGYDLKYDLTKNIKFDFHALNNAVIREPDSATYLNKEYYYNDYQNWKDTVIRSIQKFGETMNYGHNANVNITIPVNKIPLTDWINLTTRIGTSYDWQRAPFAQDGIGDTLDIGNTIQNSRNVNWSGQLNFTQLYNKIPYFKRINQKYGRGSSRGRPSRSSRRGNSSAQVELSKKFEKEWPENPPKELLDKKKMTADEYKKARDKAVEKEKKKQKEKEEKNNPFDHVARFIMMLKNASFTYSTVDGILLPGYDQNTQALGMNSDWSAPGFGFISGQQNRDLWGNEIGDFASTAAANNWMIDANDSRYLNTQHKVNHSRNINARATLEPFNGLRIELTADKNVSVNEVSNFRYDFADSIYTHQNMMETGMMSVSTIAWKTTFTKIDKKTYDSKTFQNLIDYTKNVSEILGRDHVASGQENDGYYTGYDTTQQQVLVGAFINAYTGRDPNKKNINPFNNIPLPNWRITFDGLSKIKALQKYIRKLSITHGYRSNMNLSNYTTNLEYEEDVDGNPTSQDLGGNYIVQRQFSGITITEQLSPLIGIDATWKLREQDRNGLITKFEIRKDRNVALSLTNSQVTEILGNELVIGTGYKFAQVKFPFKIGGERPENELELRLDLSIRSNRTIIRKVVENENQITSGQRTMSIKAAADYKLSDKLNLRAYFDKVVNNPFVSTTYPTANTNAGLAIRFTLAP